MNNLKSHIPKLSINTATKLFCFAMLVLFATFSQVATATASQKTGSAGGQAEVYVEVESISFDRPFWVGVEIPINEGATVPLNSTLLAGQNWILPSGFTVSQALFPAPDSFSDDNQAGYNEKLSLLFEITPPPPYEMTTTAANLPFGFVLNLAWSQCLELCQENNKKLVFELPYGDGLINSTNNEFFYNARLNSVSPISWPVEAFVEKYNYTITIVSPAPKMFYDNLIFIPTTSGFNGLVAQEVIEEGKNLVFKGQRENNSTGTQQPYFMNLSGILLSTTDHDFAYRINAKNMKDEVISWPKRQVSSTTEFSLIVAIALAFIGGLILNLMPCVFPVLAMKAFHLASSASKSPKAMRHDGILYTAGVLVSFLSVAGVLIWLRSVGNMVGWGFQLQSPIFVLILIWVLLAVSMNFLGLLSFNFAGLQNMGQSKFIERVFGGGDKATAFSTGMLATLVATPCTAPFMAPAIGYALLQSPFEALAVFASLGFGLAFPYLVLSFVPNLGRLLPRSGTWMLKVRGWLALPLGLTILWLLWVLGKQLSLTGLLVAGLSIILLALGIYIYQSNKLVKGKKLASLTVVLAMVAGAVVSDMPLEQADEPVLPGMVKGLQTVTWSPDTVEAYRREEQAIFLNVTAAWCITCLVHEKFVFENDSFQQYMAENNIIYMVADWTNPDARIAKLLEQYGRNGIPFYLYYPANPDEEAVMLPEILTPSSTINILEENR